MYLVCSVHFYLFLLEYTVYILLEYTVYYTPV